MLTQLHRIRGTLHRFETSVINRSDLQRLDPISAGHVEVLARDYTAAAKCYRASPKSTAVSQTLLPMCHLQNTEEAELSLVPTNYAEVPNAMFISSHIINNPRGMSTFAMQPSITQLRDAACQLARMATDIVAKPREPYLLGLSAFASFLTWDLGDCRFKAQRALELLTPLANQTDRLDSVVINPLIEAINLLLQMMAPFATDVRELYRSKSKLASIRQAQNKLLMAFRSQTNVPLDSKSASMAAQVIPDHVWGCLGLFGLPFSPMEFSLIDPDRRNQLKEMCSQELVF